MSGGFPVGREICNGTSIGVATGTQYGTSIAASGSANTLGSWTQLVASTTADCCWIVVQVQEATSNYDEYAIDIGVGPAASEVIIAQQIWMGNQNNNPFPGFVFEIPCSIPAGTRIAARVQSTTASRVVSLTAQLFDGAFAQVEGYAGVEAVGFTAASTSGTAVTPNASANTKGSYAQLIASTARDYAGFFLSFDPGSFSTFTGAFGVDIAIGAGGSEKIIVPDFSVAVAAYAALPPFSPILWIPIPSGTRISARCQASGASNGALNVTLNGIY